MVSELPCAMMPSAFTKPHTAGWKPRAHVRIRVKRVQRPDPRASHRRLIEREPVELAGRQVTCVRCRLELVDETGIAAIVRHVPVAVGGIRFLLVAEAPHAGQPLRCAGLWVDLPDPPRAQFGVVYERDASFVRYVFHGVIAAAQRLCRPVVITSTSLTVVPSLSSVRRDTEPQPSESSSPGRCSGTWHLPTSPSKSPGRGCVSSWLFRSHISPPGAWKSTFPSGSSGSGKVTPLSVERAGVHITASVVYE